jgi:predicted nucleotidyltransferase
MPPQTVDPGTFSRDVLELLHTLDRNRVRFMIVGGEAVIFYGHVRLTGDIDVYFERTAENADRLFAALREFWKSEIPGLEGSSKLEDRGVVLQFGAPPNRIDLLNDIDGIDFATAWPRRTEVWIEHQSESISYAYIGLDDLIENKRASGRAKDVDDLPYLIAAGKARSSDE